MSNSTDPSNRAALISAIASVGEVLLLLVGGIAGYILIQKQLTSVDLSLKGAQKELAELQRQRETTPILNVTTTHSIHSDYRDVELLTLMAGITNSALIPVTIESVQIEVYEAIPPERIRRILETDTVDYDAPELATPPPAPAPIVGNGPSHEADAAPEPTPDIPDDVMPARTSKRGELFSVHSDSVVWSPREDLDHSDDQSAILLPNQQRRVRFPFIFEQPDTPRWYKFIVTLQVSLPDGRQYPKNHEAIHIVRLGPFPAGRSDDYGPEADTAPPPEG